jgi:branched-chain amino acid transport system permease protein
MVSWRNWAFLFDVQCLYRPCTIEGPVLGALVLFGLQEALSSYGAWYLVIVGGLAVIAILVASRGLWGPGRRPVRLVPAPGRLPGASPARMTVNRPRG